MAKDFGVSPITNTIYYGTVNKEKHMFTGSKEDVTDGAIRAVFVKCARFICEMTDYEAEASGLDEY